MAKIDRNDPVPFGSSYSSLSQSTQKEKYSQQSKYEITLLSLFSLVVGLSLTDLLTTSIALREGLKEGNILLLNIANELNLSFFQTITATKIGFVLGAALLVYLGAKSTTQATKKLILRSMIVFAILLLVVSLNNLILISI